MFFIRVNPCFKIHVSAHEADPPRAETRVLKMKIPYHIGIIMDGNGRWAKQRGLLRIAGHKQGMKRVREIVSETKKIGSKILTVFAFSSENWNRPKEEVQLIFSYLEDFLQRYRKELMREDIQLRIIGRRDRMHKRTVRKIEETEKLTAKNKEVVFNIALDYGGRWDILEAARKIVKEEKQSKISIQDLDDDCFRKYLALGDLPDIDLLIRTSGEQRISNFLLWHLAYAEFYFPQIYWPDFDANELRRAVEIYSQRQRKFGGL